MTSARGVQRCAVETVVFDIGGVFIGLDLGQILLAAARLTQRTPEDLHQRLFRRQGQGSFDELEDVLDFECGRIDGREFHRRLELRLELTIPFEQFCEAWNAIFFSEIEATTQIFQALSRQPHLKVGILSNNNAIHYERLRRHLPFLDNVEHLYLSHRIGHRKPHPLAFEAVLNGMRARAETAVFIDDLPENVAAAQALGWLTIHATDAAAVHKGLNELGLLDFQCVAR